MFLEWKGRAGKGINSRKTKCRKKLIKKKTKGEKNMLMKKRSKKKKGVPLGRKDRVMTMRLQSNCAGGGVPKKERSLYGERKKTVLSVSSLRAVIPKEQGILGRKTLHQTGLTAKTLYETFQSGSRKVGKRGFVRGTDVDLIIDRS